MPPLASVKVPVPLVTTFVPFTYNAPPLTLMLPALVVKPEMVSAPDCTTVLVKLLVPERINGELSKPPLFWTTLPTLVILPETWTVA